MARGATSVEEIVNDAVSSIIERVSRSIARAIAEARPPDGRRLRLARESKRGRPSRRPRRIEITKWVADRRARRVPTFVIEATGLDTKKRIVAKYGKNAVFKKGKPLPKVK